MMTNSVDLYDINDGTTLLETGDFFVKTKKSIKFEAGTTIDFEAAGNLTNKAGGTNTSIGATNQHN
jgi:hypothetical protein